ncbi:MAG: hypothetical protein ACFBSC_09985 [Microcoleaceae cyanobacterium]
MIAPSLEIAESLVWERDAMVKSATNLMPGVGEIAVGIAPADDLQGNNIPSHLACKIISVN